MKYFFILIALVSFTNINAQRNSYFLGDWFWKEGNKTFTVHFYEEGKILKGDYQLTEEDKLGEKKIIYKSNKLVNKEFDMYFGHAINGSSTDGEIFHGIIKDNVLYGDSIHSVRNGELLIIKNDENTLIWSVTYLEIYNKLRSLKVPNEFSIPINISLSRQKK